jgi:hypothetical protein
MMLFFRVQNATSYKVFRNPNMKIIDLDSWKPEARVAVAIIQDGRQVAIPPSIHAGIMAASWGGLGILRAFQGC